MGVAALIPSLMPLLMVVAMRKAEARVHRQLSDAGAFDAQRAIPLSLSRSMDKRRLRGLIDGGAVRLTDDHRHYLDADGWERHLQKRRRRMAIALGVVVVLVVLVLAIAYSMR